MSFYVNGEYVANAREVASRFWKAHYRYAYHAKIEVTPLESGGCHGRPANGRALGPVHPGTGHRHDQ